MSNPIQGFLWQSRRMMKFWLSKCMNSRRGNKDRSCKSYVTKWNCTCWWYSLAVTPSQLGVLLHKNVILTGLQFWGAYRYNQIPPYAKLCEWQHSFEFGNILSSSSFKLHIIVYPCQNINHSSMSQIVLTKYFVLHFMSAMKTHMEIFFPTSFGNKPFSYI